MDMLNSIARIMLQQLKQSPGEKTKKQKLTRPIGVLE
jgi:hypothetical protein